MDGEQGSMSRAAQVGINTAGGAYGKRNICLGYREYIKKGQIRDTGHAKQQWPRESRPLLSFRTWSTGPELLWLIARYCAMGPPLGSRSFGVRAELHRQRKRHENPYLDFQTSRVGPHAVGLSSVWEI